MARNKTYDIFLSHSSMDKDFTDKLHDLLERAGRTRGQVPVPENQFTPDPKRHFAVHAKGDSMQTKIQDGDICVFEWYKAGTHNGEIVLTECSEKDLDYGGQYTIKKYHSEKHQTEDGWQHTKIELIPLNNDYDTIELDSEKDYRTIGVLKCVINNESK